MKYKLFDKKGYVEHRFKYNPNWKEISSKFDELSKGYNFVIGIEVKDKEDNINTYFFSVPYINSMLGPELKLEDKDNAAIKVGFTDGEIKGFNKSIVLNNDTVKYIEVDPKRVEFKIMGKNFIGLRYKGDKDNITND